MSNGFFSSQETSKGNPADNKNFFDVTGFEAGKYYGPAAITTQTTNASSGRIWFAPIYIHQKQKFDRIAARTGNATSGTARLGIYNTDLNGRPSRCIFDAGTITAAASNTAYAISIDLSLDAGWYFTAWYWNGGPSLTWSSTSTGVNLPNYAIVSSGLGNMHNCCYFTNATTSLVPISKNDSLVRTNNSPIVYLRVAP